MKRTEITFDEFEALLGFLLDASIYHDDAMMIWSKIVGSDEIYINRD